VVVGGDDGGGSVVFLRAPAQNNGKQLAVDEKGVVGGTGLGGVFFDGVTGDRSRASMRSFRVRASDSVIATPLFPCALRRALSGSQATVKQLNGCTRRKYRMLPATAPNNRRSSQATVKQNAPSHQAHLGRYFLARLPTVSS